MVKWKDPVPTNNSFQKELLKNITAEQVKKNSQWAHSSKRAPWQICTLVSQQGHPCHLPVTSIKVFDNQ